MSTDSGATLPRPRVGVNPASGLGAPVARRPASRYVLRMTRLPDKEFERLAVLHAMGALSGEEAEKFREAREERGEQGDRLIEGVERAFSGTGPGAPAATVPTERADLAAVTGRPIDIPRRWPWVVAVAVLALAAAGAGAWALSLRSALDASRSAEAAAGARADALAAEVARRDTALASIPDAAELSPILGAPDLLVVPLAGAGEPSGRLLAGPAGKGAILVVSGLPEGGGPYRLLRRTADGDAPIAELGSAPAGFLFSVFPSGGFLEDARALALATPSADATAPDSILLEGAVPRR